MEEGKYYKVEDSGGFWMIGIALSNGRLDDDGYYRSKAQFINKGCYNKNADWSYGGNGQKRTYREATNEEIGWLEYCIEKNKYMSKESYLKQRPQQPIYEIY